MNQTHGHRHCGLAYIPPNLTPIRLMAIASAASGDPTPFEGTVTMLLSRLPKSVRLAIAEALERFIDEPNALQRKA